MTTRAEKPQWQRIAEEFEASGQTQREFAGGRGLRLSKLQSWVYRRRRQVGAVAVSELPVRLVPVQVRGEPAMDAAALEVSVGRGVRVRLAPGTDVDYVARLVAALVRSTC